MGLTVDQALVAECLRVEENADHASQALLTSAGLWGKLHTTLVALAAILAFLAAALVAVPDLTGLALIAATIAGLLSTFALAVGSSERAMTHRAAGEEYLGLRNRARQVRTLTLRDTTVSAANKRKAVELLEADRAAIAKWAPDAGWFGLAFRIGARNIIKGRTRNTVDLDESKRQ